MSSLHTGAMSARRYHCPTEPPDGFRDSYAELLSSYGFRESEVPPENLTRIGWVSATDMLDSGFDDLNQWCLGDYLVFTLRIDTWKISTKLFKAHLKKRVDAWLREHNRVRCPSVVRAEIRDLLQQELAQRVLPKTTLIDIVWRLSDKIVLVGTQVESKNDTVRKLFFETFGVRLVAWSPLDHMGVDEAVADRLQTVTHYDFAGHETMPDPDLVETTERIVRKALGRDGGEDTAAVVRGQIGGDMMDEFEARMFNPWMAGEFLVYLWFVTSQVSGCKMEIHSGIVADLWVSDRLTFKGGRKDLDSTASITSESASDDYVALSALADQRLPESVRFSLRIEEREYDFVLMANTWMDLKSVKLPAVTASGGFDEGFYDRMFCLQELEDALNALWQRFCVLRASHADWHGQVDLIRSWVRDAIDREGE